MLVHFACAWCGEDGQQEAGAVNRAHRRGAKLYCSRKCSGLGRRKNKTDAEKKLAKRLYDMEYRRKNRDLLKAKKAAYHKRVYDPTEAAIKRRARRKEHAEYCRRPEYKVWKRSYDRRYRAKKQYGEFWESYLLFQDIETEVLLRMPRQQVAYINGTTNKSQKRKRELWKISPPVI